MKRGEKGEEVPAIKVQTLAEKLQRGAVVVGKKGGQSTPVLPPWRIFMSAQDSVPISQHRRAPPIPARKLAANLWELHQYRHPFSEMHSGVSGNRFRRNYADEDETHHVPDRSRDLRSAGGLRRHVVASLMQHRHSNEGNHRALPLSPGSYDSSVEVTPYNPAKSPSSSLDYKARVGEKCYSLNTSRELLKVLNHIWKLEEQNKSNLSLVKGLKKELHHAHTIIKELVMDNKADKHEIKELRHHVAEDVTNNSAIKSVRDELEDERKLRKRSEVLHRKLAGELYQVKTSLSKALKDLESERKSRELLENLCDEFALEIQNYERKLCTECDPLILQISEKWLGERSGTRVGEEGQNGNKTSVADKFGSEIESFLQAKRTSHSKRIVNIRRSSLESVPLNGASSAPQEVGDEDDSGSDSHCFELNRPSIGGLADLREGEAQGTQTLTEPNPTMVEVKFEDQKTQPSSSKQVEVKPGISEVGAEGGDDRGKSHMHPGHGSGADSSVWRRNASPVRQWATSFQPQDIELSSKLPSNLKDNTLKAKLVETRTRAQRSRPRLKASKGFR